MTNSTICGDTTHDGEIACVDPDPEHLGNHHAEGGEEWFNDRDFGAPPTHDEVSLL